jgi:hypothetical protein
MTPARIAGLVATFAVAGFLPGDMSASSAADSAMREASPAFAEVKWPFLLDQWGDGRAFQCPAAHCGIDINVYLRAKVGFCSCTTGVSDDNELERVGDLEIFGGRYSALENGHRVAMGPLQGRARPFSVELPFTRPFFALAVAVNNRCDAVVATVMTAGKIEPAIERAALNFLNTAPILKWAEASTGLPE